MSEEAAEYHTRAPEPREWTADEIISGLENVDYDEVERIADKLGEILAGRHPGIQCCALANALAMWLMGHDNAEVRAQLLAAHIESVRELIAKG
jgi:hypothetical protein